MHEPTLGTRPSELACDEGFPSAFVATRKPEPTKTLLLQKCFGACPKTDMIFAVSGIALSHHISVVASIRIQLLQCSPYRAQKYPRYSALIGQALRRATRPTHKPHGR